MNSLAQKLSILARPGIRVTGSNEYLSLMIVTRSSTPERKLIIFRATPTNIEFLNHETQIIQAFSEFSETTAMLIEQAKMQEIQPLVLSQQIFNLAIFQNSFSWRIFFHFSLEYLEENHTLWENI